MINKIISLHEAHLASDSPALCPCMSCQGDREAAGRLVGGDRMSPMADPLAAPAAVAEAIVATKAPFKPEDLVPRMIHATQPVEGFVEPVNAEEEMARFDITPGPEAVSLVGRFYHKAGCDGACDIPFGCASQWQPDEIARMQAHGPKRDKFPTKDDVNRFAPQVELRERTSAERKGEPIHSGVMLYFPDALAAIARLSKAGNDKHNPGEPLHWARGKSMDQMDAAARHMLTLSKTDAETKELEAVANGWRALAELQLLEEKRLVAAGIMPYSGVTS